MSDIYGRQPVLEILRSDQEVNKLLVQRGQRQGSIREILAVAKEKGILVQEVDKVVLDKLTDGSNHQGVVAQTAGVQYWSLEDLIKREGSSDWDPFLVVLDGIQDPHNLGSIIRSAEALGADGIIIPRRRAVGVTGTVMKSSAGAASHVPICRVTNLAASIDHLKKEGYWVVGADMDGETCFSQNLTGSIALVIGSEGSGLSKLIKDKCDFLSSIPMRGEINSLNASVAAALLMFEVVRQRG